MFLTIVVVVCVLYIAAGLVLQTVWISPEYQVTWENVRRAPLAVAWCVLFIPAGIISILVVFGALMSLIIMTALYRYFVEPDDGPQARVYVFSPPEGTPWYVAYPVFLFVVPFRIVTWNMKHTLLGVMDVTPRIQGPILVEIPCTTLIDNASRRVESV